MSLFKIYSSSAGSGKTFTLTKEYLKIILRESDPHYFKRILAMTFTNDAAGEMKKRIMDTLKEISKDDPGSSNMFKLLLEELPEFSQEEIQKKAGKILHEIIQDYNNFAIKTIDSFVNQIAGSFNQDLDLAYNYDLVLDTQPLLAEAVRNLIDRIGRDEELTELFKRFALSKTEEDKSWNTLERDIVDFSKVIFNDQVIDLIEENNDLNLADINEMARKTQKYFAVFESRIKALVDEGLRTITEKGLGQGDFYQGSRGVFAFFKFLSEDPKKLYPDNKNRLVPNNHVMKGVNENKWYTGKKSNPTIDSISPKLKSIIEEIIELKTEKYPILKAIYPNLFKIPFLSHIKNEVDNLKIKRNEEVLAEFNKKILAIVSQEPVPYIYERIGEKYNHILVDEFQDTSDIQFFNILPLLENTISKQHENLIVGDPKQAIYSWRGGNVLLMMDLINKEKTYLAEKTPAVQIPQVDALIRNSETIELQYNWRSKEEIINFNNSFFKYIVENEKSPAVRQVFSSYEQKVPPVPRDGGYVEVMVFEEKNNENREIKVKEELPELVKNILGDGFQASDIAVLVRKGDEGAFIAEVLNRAGYKVKSSDSLKLMNNLEIKLLIAALQFLNRPEKSFEKFEFIELYARVKNIDTSHWNLEEICNQGLKNFEKFLKSLDIDLAGLEGLAVYPVIEHLIERLKLFENKNATQFLLAFLDWAYDYNSRKSQNISDFLEFWDLKKERLSIQSGSKNAITVQTIHKAKGLEYPIVIFPFISGKPNLSGETWQRVDQLAYEELQTKDKKLVAAPIGKGSKFRFDFNQEIFDRREEVELIETLNIQYVALTRAVERLYLWLWGDSSDTNNYGLYLSNFIKEKTAEPYFTMGEKTAKKQKQAKTSQTKLYKQSIPILNPSQQKLRSTFADRDESILSGNIIHEVFEEIKHHSDIEPVLIKLKPRIDQTTFESIETKINEVTSHPLLKDLFDEEAIIKNEVEILSASIGSKRPDRIVIQKNKVSVIDYKSGERHQSHHQQLIDYGNLLTQMGYQNIDLKLVYLEPLEIVNIKT